MFGFRFSVAPLLALLVFAMSIGIIWLAHIEAGEMTAYREPPLVKASTAPLKRSPDDPGGSTVADLGGVRDLLRDQPETAEERLLPRTERPRAPADGDAAPDTSGSRDAREALEALVSEARRGDAARAGGDAGIGGPNPDEPVNFPSPSRPTAAVEEGTPVSPFTSDRETRSASVDQPRGTDVAIASPTFATDADGRYRVQLAAVRAEEDAKRAWALFQEQLGPFIVGLQPFFERAETDNGVFYRVQVGPFGETSEADRLCVELKKQDASCFVVSR